MPDPAPQGGDPSLPPPLVTPPSLVAAPAPPPVVPPPAGEPPWLPDRLQQAQRAGQSDLLKKHGLNTADELDARLKRLNELELAGKSAEERMAAEMAALRTKAAQADELMAERAKRLESDRVLATAELATLNEHQRAAVIALGGDNPTAQLSAIRVLRTTWGTASAAAPVPAPASSAPALGAPPAPNGAAQPNHLATYTDLERRNPIAAAHYLIQNFDAIQKAKQAST